MKKRRFKNWIDILYNFINIMLLCFIIMINDYTNILYYLLLIIIFIINCKILKKYSKIFNKIIDKK